MRRTIHIALAILLLFQAADLGSILAPQQCSLGCPSDEGDDSCAPLCPECVCCPSLRIGVETKRPVSSPSLSGCVIEARKQPPPSSAEPAEIFHIPKASFA